MREQKEKKSKYFTPWAAVKSFFSQFDIMIVLKVVRKSTLPKSKNQWIRALYRCFDFGPNWFEIKILQCFLIIIEKKEVEKTLHDITTSIIYPFLTISDNEIECYDHQIVLTNRIFKTIFPSIAIYRSISIFWYH